MSVYFHIGIFALSHLHCTSFVARCFLMRLLRAGAKKTVPEPAMLPLTTPSFLGVKFLTFEVGTQRFQRCLYGLLSPLRSFSQSGGSAKNLCGFWEVKTSGDGWISCKLSL